MYFYYYFKRRDQKWISIDPIISENIASYVHDRCLVVIQTDVSIILFKEQKTPGRTKYAKNTPENKVLFSDKEKIGTW